MFLGIPADMKLTHEWCWTNLGFPIEELRPDKSGHHHYNRQKYANKHQKWYQRISIWEVNHVVTVSKMINGLSIKLENNIIFDSRILMVK